MRGNCIVQEKSLGISLTPIMNCPVLRGLVPLFLRLQKCIEVFLHCSSFPLTTAPEVAPCHINWRALFIWFTDLLVFTHGTSLTVTKGHWSQNYGTYKVEITVISSTRFLASRLFRKLEKLSFPDNLHLCCLYWLLQQDPTRGSNSTFKTISCSCI